MEQEIKTNYQRIIEKRNKEIVEIYRHLRETNKKASKSLILNTMAAEHMHPMMPATRPSIIKILQKENAYN